MLGKIFHIVTFGCQMNVRDSSWLRASLESRGFHYASLEEARIIIINTCSVREKPERKLSQLIREISGKSRNNPEIMIAVTGCVAQQLGKKIFEFSPQVRLVCGTDAIAKLPKALDKLIAEPNLKINDISFEAVFPMREMLPEKWPHGSAYINIMQGCDNFCSYCIVPYTRGRQKSRPEDEILEECKNVLQGGASELTLLGQNVNAWGKDNQAGVFPELLAKISALDGLKRLHFTSPHPADMDEKTINAFGELDNLCPRLHLPLQSGSNSILQKMRRRYDRTSFINLVEKLRGQRADLALSTDLIVGFPGEREKDFLDTLEMIDICQFMSSYSFVYSDRPGTMASLMKDKIAPELKQERLLRLQEVQDKLSAKWLKGRLYTETEILVEGLSRRKDGDQITWQGKDPYGTVINVSLIHAEIGKYRRVFINETGKHSLKASDMDANTENKEGKKI